MPLLTLFYVTVDIGYTESKGPRSVREHSYTTALSAQIIAHDLRLISVILPVLSDIISGVAMGEWVGPDPHVQTHLEINARAKPLKSA